MLLVVALAPALLQLQYCGRGDTRLQQLQFVPTDTGVDQIVDFDPDNRSYALTMDAAQATLTALAQENDATVTYQWLVGGQSIEAAVLGAGGGSALLDVPEGRSILHIGVRAAEGNLGPYRVAVDRRSPAPMLAGSDPSDGAQNVPAAAWLKLSFAESVRGSIQGLALSCDSVPLPITSHLVEPQTYDVIVNPVGQLPAAAACQLAWDGPLGQEVLVFSTAPAGAPAVVLYDRSDASRYAPYPDDVWLVADGSTPTGVRVELPTIQRLGVDAAFYSMKRAAEAVGYLDGFSPLGPIVIELSDAPDTTSIPLDPTESLDPMASIGLFDLNRGSESYGQRIPFDVHIRAARRSIAPTEPLQHALVLFPSIALTPGGSYGLIVTRRAQVDPSRPFEPSSFTSAALADPTPGEASELSLVRPLAREAVDVVTEQGNPPIPSDDVAFSLRFSVRSTDSFKTIPLKMKEDVLNMPAPVPRVTRVEPGFAPWAAFVYAEWDAPNWRGGVELVLGPDGRPVVTQNRPVEFVIGIPDAAQNAPVPVTMYQHGSGSGASEQIYYTSIYLAGAGFAVAGFTDNIHREISYDSVEQNTAALTHLLLNGRVPDYWIETTGEQLSFVRMLSELCNTGCDFVPFGAPDGQPDFDLSQPLTYVGISEGSNKGQALMPYAPEIAAGALVTGGLRGAEIFFFQDPVGPGGNGTGYLDTINNFYSAITPVDLWVGLGLFQLGFDYQDPQNHAAFMYANPVEVAGTTRKPSVMIQEGLIDSLIPRNCTRGLAQTMGLVPVVAPVKDPVPYLPVATPPLTGNLASGTATAGMIQYVAQGALPGVPPDLGCEFETEGHYCGQIADAAIQQRLQFFQTALTDPVPTIFGPSVP